MKKFTLILSVYATILGVAMPLLAKDKPISPRDTISAVIDSSKITIAYGRPYTKHPKTGEVRKIWGGLVPYDKIWRAGANEATILTTEKPLIMNGTIIPAGSYSLFMLPVENAPSKLVINKQTGQWGLTYDEKKDLARIDLKKESLDQPVTQFTMTIDKNPSGGGVLTLEWENTRFSVPFTIQK